MSGRNITKAAVDQSTIIRIIDSVDGTPETGVVAATAGLSLSYRREGEAVVALTALNDLALLTTAHTDGGILHIGNGYYRVDPQDAAWATGSTGVLIFGTATGMIVIGTYHSLVDLNLEGQSAEDLKDFADAGYDPVTNKVQGVVLVDTLTTYTGNTPQTGDSFARIGAGGVALTLIPWNGAWDVEVQSEVNDALLAQNVDKQILANGFADSGSTTTMVDAGRTEADSDYWKGAAIQFTSGAIAGQVRLVTAFDPVTDTLTFAPATTQAVTTQSYVLIPAARADVQLWLGSPANALVSGRVDASVGAMAANTLTAAALATDAREEIADQVWDEPLAAHTTGDTPGQVLNMLTQDTVTLSTDVALGSILGQMLDNGTTWTYDRTTDSLEAIRDRGDAAWITGTTPPTVGAIADAVWDETLADHLAAGSTGNALNAAGAVGDPWTTALPGAYGAGTAGNIVGNRLDVAVGTRLATTGYTAPDNATITSIQADTDNIQTRLPAALVAGRIDAHVGSVAAAVLTAASFAAGAFDAVWTVAARLLTAGTNIVLAKGVGVTGFNDLSAAQVNAEMVDTLATDTYAEPGQETPAAALSLATKLGYLMKAWRNRHTQTATQYSLYNDNATVVDHKATFSDDGTTADRGEVATGP